jgi:hypothetical protein
MGLASVGSENRKRMRNIVETYKLETGGDISQVRKSPHILIAMLVFCIGWTFIPHPGSLALAAPANSNGAAGQMPAYYDGELFTVNMMEMPNSDALIENNTSINTIYASNDLDEEQDFVPVIDAIQGDGFNPLWQQVFIVFNEGFTPHQFFSDDEIEQAASGDDPEITLVVTDEMYRCSVVGAK